MSVCLTSFLIIMLTLSACYNNIENPTKASDNSSQTSSSSKPLESDEQSEATSSTSTTIQNNSTKNTALERIPELADIPENMLAGMVEYNIDVNWHDVLTIETVEDSGTNGYSVYLFVPYYTGSTIQVYSIKYDETAEKIVEDELIFESTNTPDDYGLIISSNEPEGMPDYSVVITYNSESATHMFSYYGRGEYPYEHDNIYVNGGSRTNTALENGYNNYEGRFFADVNYGHAGFGDMVYFQMGLPQGSEFSGWYNDWPDMKLHLDLEYDMTFWGYYLSENNVSNFYSPINNIQGTNESYSLTRNGLRIERGSAKQEQNLLIYAIEPEDELYMFLQFERSDGEKITIEEVADIDGVVVTMMENYEIIGKLPME